MKEFLNIYKKKLNTIEGVEGVTKKSRLTNCRFTTISSQISTIDIDIFHKTEVQTVILRCKIDLKIRQFTI